MRTAMDLCPPNALLDRALESPRFRAVARTIFFHHRGLLSSDLLRDMAPAVLRPDRSPRSPPQAPASTRAGLHSG
jgi:hypothetical protein